MTSSFGASAPGKIILCGEHSVVHGKHALATVVEKRTSVRITLEDSALQAAFLQLTLPPILFPAPYCFTETQWATVLAALPEEKNSSEQTLIPSPSGPVWDAITTLTQVAPAQICLFYLAHMVGVHTQRMSFLVTSDLPLGAGLGSSASYCVAMAAAIYHLSHRDSIVTEVPDKVIKEKINEWAYQGECVLHGNPSGVDNTVISHGGAILYRKGAKLTHLDSLPHLRVLVTNTKVPRNTKELVAGVGRLHKAIPEVTSPVLTAMDHIATQFADLLTHSKERPTAFEELGQLMTVNQHLLGAIGVGHKAIDFVVHLGAEHGFATKLSGAGGGGCVISLVPKGASVADFQKDATALGFEAFETVMGQEGIVFLH